MEQTMHIIPVNFNEFKNRVRITCPYCQKEQLAPVGEHIYQHNCKNAGTIYFLNGHCFVGVPNFVVEDKNSTRNKR